MKHKILTMLLCGAMVFSLAACGSSSTDASNDGEGEMAEEVTIEPNTVLLDHDGIVITAEAMEYDSIWGTGVQLLIENNGENSVSVFCDSLAVNNYMIGDLFSATVAPGKKDHETLYLSSSELEAIGINTITEIAMRFDISDPDTYATLYCTDEILLKTSAYGTMEQPPLDEGMELVNQDGVRVVGRYVNEDSFWGAGVQLFIENQHGSDIIVQCDDMSVNGFMVSPLFSCDVSDGKMAVDEITIMSSDLEENGIESIEDIELTFQILDSATFGTIYESDAVSFPVSKEE